MCSSEKGKAQRHAKMCSNIAQKNRERPKGEAKRKPAKSGAAGHAGPSEPNSRGSGGASSSEAMQAGSSEVMQNKLQEYPPLGEVQLRGVHSNARSLVRLPGSR